MNLKRMLLIFIAFMMCCVGVMAESYEVKIDKNAKNLVIVKYKDNLISDVECIAAETDKEMIEFVSDDAEFKTFLVYDNKIERVNAQLKKETQDKKEEIKDTYVQSYPSIYEKEKDANRSVIVVDSVSYISENDENYVSVKAMYLGEKREFLISEDVVLEYVPEAYSELKGGRLTALKRGDIIKLTASFSGKIEKASLIFRPTPKNPILSENNYGNGFSKLFSENGMVAGDNTYKVATPENGISSKGYNYAFGVIKEYKNYTLELSDVNGEILEADVADGAFIYVCDTEEKFTLTSGSNGSIRKGAGSKSAFTDENVFLGWDNDKNLNYAFIRTISGVATEVVIYKNY